MKIQFLIGILGLGGGSSALDPQEFQSQKEGLERWSLIAESTPNPELIEKLGEGIRKTNMPSIYSIDGTKEVADKLANALISIPGHAEFYRDRILTSRVRAQSDLNDMNRFGPSFTKFMNERSNGFVTLRNLPSVETVRVLGEFLSDDWVSPLPVQGSVMDSPMSLWAVRSLSRLPFAPKPVPTKFDHEAERDLPAWQAWYEQIKSGKRTLRFEGDPTEYDLNGPAPGQKLAHISRSQKRDAERSTGQKKSPASLESESVVTQISTPFFIAAAIAACALGVAMFWYFYKGRRTA